MAKKLDDQSKAFQEELSKERAKIQDSESIQNYEALKQLVLKVCGLLVGGLIPGRNIQLDSRKRI